MDVDGEGVVPTALRPGREPLPIVQEGGWAPGTVWMCAENFTPTEIRSQNLPALASHYTDCAMPAHSYT